MWRRLIVVPAIAAVALGALVGVEIAHPSTPPDRPSARERVEIQARETFHLSTDLRHIRYADEHFGQSYVGAPITTAERRRLIAQGRVGRHIPAITELVDKQPGFGGIWLDFDGNGSIAIGWVGAVPAPVRESVAAALPKATPVHFVAARNTYSELRTIQARVTRVMSGGISNADGGVIPTIYVAYVNDPSNRVEITVATRADIAAAYRLFGRAGVHVEVGGQPVAG